MGISIKNQEGYMDTTPYEAIKNVMKGGNDMEIYGGDIFKARLNGGGEKEFVLLAVHNKFSTVLMLSDNESLPVSVIGSSMKYTDPGQIQYIYNDNLVEFIRSMKQKEYDELMRAVADGLGIKQKPQEAKEIPVVKEIIKEVPKAVPEASEELTKARAERDVYKQLYENLIGSMIAR